MRDQNYYLNEITRLYRYILKELNVPFPSKTVIKLLDDYTAIGSEKYFPKSLNTPLKLTGTDYYPFLKEFDDDADNSLLLNCISEQLAYFLTGPTARDFDRLQDKNIIDNLVSSIKEKINAKIDKCFLNQSKLFIELSNTKYEKKPCKGSIIYSDNYNGEVFIKLLSPEQKIEFCPHNKRLIRKLLEITDDHTALLITSQNHKYYVSGLVELDTEKEKCYYKFCGYRHFQFCNKSNVFIEYNTDSFKAQSQNEISELDLSKLRAFFDNDPNKYNCITSLIDEIKLLGDDFHGALIVFTDDSPFVEKMFHFKRSTLAYNCSDLNIFKCFCNKDVNPLRKRFIARLSCIDGATIIGVNGDILSFGTILDGRADCSGRVDRGSRFNSTLTFIDDYYKSFSNDKYKYLGIVMSEDGNINVLDKKLDQE